MVFPPQSLIAADFDRSIPFIDHWATPPMSEWRSQNSRNLTLLITPIDR